MKKFIALAIAIVMLAALAVPAFAATVDADEDSSFEATGDTTVNYGITSTYTLSIPDALTLGGEAATFGISAINIYEAEKVQVTVETDGILVQNNTAATEHADAFAIVVGEEEANTEFVVDFTSVDVTKTVKAVTTAGTPDASGTYTGTVTFSAVITARA